MRIQHDCPLPVQVSVPDVHPADLVQGPGLLSMCAGDFVEVYSAPDQAGAFDCVATCFFLDTAHNILQYMQIIRHILKVRHLPKIPIVLLQVSFCFLHIACSISLCHFGIMFSFCVQRYNRKLYLCTQNLVICKGSKSV